MLGYLLKIKKCKSYVWLGFSAFNGGIPISIHVPLSILAGADTIKGKLEALRFLDTETYACCKNRANSNKMCGLEYMYESTQP